MVKTEKMLVNEDLGRASEERRLKEAEMVLEEGHKTRRDLLS